MVSHVGHRAGSFDGVVSKALYQRARTPVTRGVVFPSPCGMSDHVAHVARSWATVCAAAAARRGRRRCEGGEGARRDAGVRALVRGAVRVRVSEGLCLRRGHRSRLNGRRHIPKNCYVCVYAFRSLQSKKHLFNSGSATASRWGGGGQEPFEVDSFHATSIGLMLKVENI